MRRRELRQRWSGISSSDFTDVIVVVSLSVEVWFWWRYSGNIRSRFLTASHNDWICLRVFTVVVRKGVKQVAGVAVNREASMGSLA